MIKKDIYKELQRRILILDGGLGTMIQSYSLCEQDYRGERFSQWHVPLKGCNDLLVITAPHVLEQIHSAYFDAGADIVSTNTFNANNISLSDYGLGEYAYQINLTATRLARSVADRYTVQNPDKPRFVAGSIGPTSRSTSIAADVNDPFSRSITFDRLVESYSEQLRGMVDGGADLFILETVFDTLNAKAALFAINRFKKENGIDIPIMVSGTLTDAAGRTLSGQTVEAFYNSVSHAGLLSIGLNCAFGAKQLLPYLSRLASVARCRVSVHPNAGLPNIMGGYDQTAQMMASDIEEYLCDGLVNIVGGCCGTTPEYIAAIAAVAKNYSPRPMPVPNRETILSGLEPLRVTAENNFINIGERTNVAGSAKFARLIREGNYEQALAVARDQVDAGAQVVDVCMDDGLIDGVQAMTRFLNGMMSEPEIARVPVMIDSSRWEVLEAGLKCIQGKGIVNSISLKEGENILLEHAHAIHNYGASAVVMLFDEHGQADTFSRKIAVAERSYRVLVDAGFPAEDIIFDPNILAVATGIEQHNNYGVDFIEACRWIKENLPYCKVSGGVSNLSFALRGNNVVREAMHSVFLYHAIAAGMDMAIVNAAALQVYTDIASELLELAEDVVLNRREDAAERLISYAQRTKEDNTQVVRADDSWRMGTLAQRINHAMIKGDASHVMEDALEAYHELGSPVKTIDQLLMPAMEYVGELFGQGKMFLPQVVKSARVMKVAVSALEPYMSTGDGLLAREKGKVLVATVKGDVHDIGKNIVSVVMSCNGYDIRDVGVMAECDTIVNSAMEWGANVVGLSGLITPSLEEMINVVKRMESKGLRIPVLIGGATTSALHTAVRIAPHYSGLVVHVRDASDNIRTLSHLLGDNAYSFEQQIRSEQAGMREGYQQTGAKIRTLSEARTMRMVKNVTDVVVPAQTGRMVLNDYPLDVVLPYIDWQFFFSSWDIKGRYPQLLNDTEKGDQARKLLADAQAMLDKIVSDQTLTLQAVAGVFHACSDGDDIVVVDIDGNPVVLPELRNQSADLNINLSLADFVLRCGEAQDVIPGCSCHSHSENNFARDYVGAFAVTAGVGLQKMMQQYRDDHDQYSAIMCKLLADRLTEAFAQVVHSLIRQSVWGYERESEFTPEQILKGDYQGIRVAFGYPASPDHSLKREIFDLLDVEEFTAMKLNDSFMISPAESLCGLIFAHGDARYFDVGRVDDVQLQDYADRRGMTVDDIKRLIPKNIR